MPSYPVNPNDATSPTDTQGAKQGAEELRALKGKVNGIVAGAITLIVANYAGPAGLVDFLHINSRYSHRDLIADGWMPSWFNQQWGGGPHYHELLDWATGVQYKFEAFDGYVDDEGTSPATLIDIGSAAARYKQYQSFNPSKNLSLQAVWCKFYKIANPTDNIVLELWSAGAGVPNALIATANVISGKQVTSDSAGQWYRFSFAAVQALVAGTTYYWVLTRSGAADAVNYYHSKGKGTTRFPNNLHGFGTVVPAWTATNTISKMFLVEAQVSDQSLTAGGTFNDGKYTFYEGNPINRTNSRSKELRDFKDFHPDDFTLALWGGSYTKDKTILDITYGLDHDRIVLRSKAATGLPELTIYERDGTVATVTGVTDVSTAGDKLLSIRVRAKNDGADTIQIWVNGAKEAELTLASYDLDELFAQAQIGTFILGGGWNLASAFAWTQKLDMTVLPSAAGWAFTTTTATVEGNEFAVANGKLNMIRAGMGATDGWYRKAALALSNANGWVVGLKGRTTYSDNTVNQSPCALTVYDGTKLHKLTFHEFFMQRFDGGAYVALQVPQIDHKSRENVVVVAGKGSDAYHFVNGKLLEDVTSFMTGASGANQIDYGDDEPGAGRNADAVLDYLAYYNTALVLPGATSGYFSEFMLWSGDKTALLATLYNAGVPLSGKQVLGVKQDRLVDADVTQMYYQRGLASGPNTASAAATPAMIPEMETFSIGDFFSLEAASGMANSGAGGISPLIIFTDGAQKTEQIGANTGYPYAQSVNAGSPVAVSTFASLKFEFGLHKHDIRFHGDGAVTTSSQISRRMRVTAKVGSK